MVHQKQMLLPMIQWRIREQLIKYLAVMDTLGESGSASRNGKHHETIIDEMFFIL